ncbi:MULTISPECIES: hypothetical protein [unclassified Bacillus (in: firmicutes)]
MDDLLLNTFGTVLGVVVFSLSIKLSIKPGLLEENR